VTSKLEARAVASKQTRAVASKLEAVLTLEWPALQQHQFQSHRRQQQFQLQRLQQQQELLQQQLVLRRH
jgi:hypothetical protein